MRAGSIRNYITDRERKRVDDKLDSLLLNTNLSYPEDSLIDIIKTAIRDVEILEYPFDKSIRGAIYKKSQEFITPKIIIRSDLRPEQKTFALAHELGHYLLDHPGKANFLLDKMVYDGSNRQQLEAQAQYFAASLLMPQEQFNWLGRVLDDESLAKRFGVPVAAVRIRRDWLR